jgi:SAM-dependent methyltransferase
MTVTIWLAAALASRAPYWRDPRIHNLGNTGLGGVVHAAIAPLATKIIDHAAYGGVDVRRRLLDSLPPEASVVDLCCGVGLSTHVNATGVDSSPQMAFMARLVRGIEVEVGNAETWGETDAFSVATLMYATHEMPQEGRRAVLANAVRVSHEAVLVADIELSYQPHPLMLTGEPYILDYLQSMQADVDAIAAQHSRTVVSWTEAEERVRVWLLVAEHSRMPFGNSVGPAMKKNLRDHTQTPTLPRSEK